MKEQIGDGMLKVGALLEGDFGPGPVRVLRVCQLGSSIQVEGVGTKTQELYSPILRAQDLARVRLA